MTSHCQMRSPHVLGGDANGGVWLLLPPPTGVLLAGKRFKKNLNLNPNRVPLGGMVGVGVAGGSYSRVDALLPLPHQP
jgi:hypothetical protein